MSVAVPVTQRRSSLPGGIPSDVELPRFLVSTFHSSLGIRLSSQVRHQLAQVHFCVSGLEAALHRGLSVSIVCLVFSCMVGKVLALRRVHHHLHIARELCRPDLDRPPCVFRDEATELHMVGFTDKLFRRCATLGLRYFIPLPSSLRPTAAI